MVNPENSEGIEFRKLGLRGFEQFYRMIEQGTIICPKPDGWNNFYENFVQRANPDRDLLPRILGGWWSTTNEEKNAVFRKQLDAAGGFYDALGVQAYTWQKEIFDYFEHLQGRQSELVVVWKKASVNLVVSNLVQRFRTSGKENFQDPHLDENYCQFGGCSGIGDNVRPTADIRLKSDIYDYVEKAFGMSNPQIEFKLEFTEPIQREGMSLSFDQHTKNSRSSNHFTLDTDAIGGTGIWHAYCELVEIKNVPSTTERVSD